MEYQLRVREGGFIYFVHSRLFRLTAKSCHYKCIHLGQGRNESKNMSLFLMFLLIFKKLTYYLSQKLYSELAPEISQWSVFLYCSTVSCFFLFFSQPDMYLCPHGIDPQPLCCSSSDPRALSSVLPFQPPVLPPFLFFLKVHKKSIATSNMTLCSAIKYSS